MYFYELYVDYFIRTYYIINKIINDMIHIKKEKDEQLFQ